MDRRVDFDTDSSLFPGWRLAAGGWRRFTSSSETRHKYTGTARRKDPCLIILPKVGYRKGIGVKTDIIGSVTCKSNILETFLWHQ